MKEKDRKEIINEIKEFIAIPEEKIKKEKKEDYKTSSKKFDDILKIDEITNSGFIKEQKKVKEVKEEIKEEIIKDEIIEDKDAISSVEEDIKEEIIGQSKEDTSDLHKVVTILLNDLWKRRKTRLRARSIPALTTIDTLSQIYDVKFLRLWIDGYTEYVTSEGGKGRQEIVDITKYTIDKANERDKKMMEMWKR